MNPMTKFLVASLALLCAPALAGSPPSPTLQVGFRLGAGPDARHYAVKLVGTRCGTIKSNTASIEVRIGVCAKAVGAATQLEIDWYLREGDHQLTNKSTIVLARGASQEIDGGTTKLEVTLQ